MSELIGLVDKAWLVLLVLAVLVALSTAVYWLMRPPAGRDE